MVAKAAACVRRDRVPDPSLGTIPASPSEQFLCVSLASAVFSCQLGTLDKDLLDALKDAAQQGALAGQYSVHRKARRTLLPLGERTKSPGCAGHVVREYQFAFFV